MKTRFSSEMRRNDRVILNEVTILFNNLHMAEYFFRSFTVNTLGGKMVLCPEPRRRRRHRVPESFYCEKGGIA